jgi:L-ascorbate metabolism protein UlaG (beta-lactamase superfamily)
MLMAEIKWFGHACFLIRARGVSVLMDPVPADSGYDMGSPEVDIVTVSHDHHGHSAVDLVPSDYRLLNGPGDYEIKEVFIHGVRTYHDNERGAKLGKNTVYVVEIEDVVIAHLGDIGHVLSEEQVEAMSSVDVLIIPAGGGPTITASQAAEIIGQVEPRIVIPMQFRTERGDHDREPIDTFLREVGAKEYRTEERLVVRKSDGSETPQIVVLQPA